MSMRTERDFLGPREIPADAYYGVQTQRGMDNFRITGVPMSAEPEFVRAFGYVKKAVALALSLIHISCARPPRPRPCRG